MELRDDPGLWLEAKRTGYLYFPVLLMVGRDCTLNAYTLTLHMRGYCLHATYLAMHTNKRSQIRSEYREHRCSLSLLSLSLFLCLRGGDGTWLVLTCLRVGGELVRGDLS